jgi:preprotein translocase subunit SecD
VEGHGEFAATGITEEDMVWADAAEDEQKKGVVRLTFTPQGSQKLAAVFKENKGKSIGIFVRDRLISKLTVQTDVIEDHIVIRDIPSSELARIFVDDLNVGLHVTFTKLP